jgi:hypothetical protein
VTAESLQHRLTGQVRRRGLVHSGSPRAKVGVPERGSQISQQLASQPSQRGVARRLGILRRCTRQSAEAPGPLQRLRLPASGTNTCYSGLILTEQQLSGLAPSSASCNNLQPFAWHGTTAERATKCGHVAEWRV